MNNILKWVGIVGVSIALLLLRSPETITHPQFWAEDGTFWYADAYNQGGFSSTLHSYGGYFQTISRLTAWLSLAVPLHNAPLIFNIIALSIQLLGPIILLSGRFDELIPNRFTQYFCAFFLLLMPNTAEIHGNITNSQWHLSIAAFLILIAATPQTTRAKIFDFSVLLLSALSGPFSLFLFPVAAIMWLARRSRAHLMNGISITIGGFVQAISILFLNHAERLFMAPQFDAKLIFAIFARQIIFGPIIGANGYMWALANIPYFTVAVLIISIIATACIVYAVIRAQLEIKLALLFGALIFTVSLLSPTGDFSQIPAFSILSRTNSGIRYWLIPMFAFVAVLVWCATSAKLKFVKLFCSVLLMVSLVGITTDFRHPDRPKNSLLSEENRINDAVVGEHIIIPITPRGWTMDLIKK